MIPDWPQGHVFTPDELFARVDAEDDDHNGCGCSQDSYYDD